MATLTVYPDAGAGGPTGDVCFYQFYGTGSGVAWATIRATGADNVDTSASTWFTQMRPDGSLSGKWRYLARGGFTLPISGMGTGATITAGTFSLEGNAKSDSNSITPDLNIYDFNPATNYNFAAADYGNFTTTAYSTAITYANFSTVGYNDFALNATALTDMATALAGSGIFPIGCANANYDAANSAPTWGDDLGNNNLTGYYADQAGTTSDPKLVVTYTPGVTFVGKVMIF